MAARTPIVIVAAGLVAVVTGAAAASLQSDETEVLTEVATPGDLGGVSTIRYAIWDYNQAAVQQQLIGLFTSRNPNIRIQLEVIDLGEYWSVLADSASGRGAIDVAWMNAPNFRAYSDAGSLLSLQPLADSGSIDITAFPQPLIDLYTADGELLGLSKDLDTIGLFYNRTLFDQAGVDYPTAEWTWSDLRQAATALTTEQTWGFGAATDTQTNLFPAIAQNGGQVISEDGHNVLLDSEQACGAVEWLYRFQADGLAPDQHTLDDTNQRELFAQSRVAMIFEGSWQVEPLTSTGLDVGVAPLPSGTERANIVHGLAWVGLSRTDHPEAVREFISFLGSEEAQLIQAQSGVVISSRAGTQQAWIDRVDDELDATVFIDEIDFAEPYPTSPAPGTWIRVTRSVLRDGFRGEIEFPHVCSVAAEAGTLFIKDALAEQP